MDENHVKLILDRFQASDNLVKTVETGIHRRMDIFADQLEEVKTNTNIRLQALEEAPKKSGSWKNITIGGIMVAILEAGRTAYGWFKG